MPAPWPPYAFGTAVASSFALRSASKVSIGNRLILSTSAACFAATSAAIAAVPFTTSLFFTDERVVTARKIPDLHASCRRCCAPEIVEVTGELAGRK